MLAGRSEHPSRLAFDPTHECAHMLLYRRLRAQADPSGRRPEDHEEPHEVRANGFAAAFLMSATGIVRIIAVVRYAREAGGERAEYAALVEDRWQGLGLGLALTSRLIEAARDRSIRRLYAPVTPGNERMLRLLRGLGLPTRASREGGAERVEVDPGRL